MLVVEPVEHFQRGTKFPYVPTGLSMWIGHIYREPIAFLTVHNFGGQCLWYLRKGRRLFRKVMKWFDRAVLSFQCNNNTFWQLLTAKKQYFRRRQEQFCAKKNIRKRSWWQNDENINFLAEKYRAEKRKCHGMTIINGDWELCGNEEVLRIYRLDGQYTALPKKQAGWC